MRPILACLLVTAACGGGGGDDDDDGAQPEWQVVSDGQPSSLLSVWSSSASDVWVVGGDTQDGKGSAVFHYDGAAWTRLDTGGQDDLWWVFGFEGGPVFMSGSLGTILRYENGRFERLATPGTATVFGMWGAAPDDLWAVGGNNGGSAGFAWRFDGEAWSEAELPADITAEDTVWKVSGLDADDVWMSATLGKTLHWDGESLDLVQIPGTDASMTSVAGNAERFIAVGGQSEGEIYENTGDGWSSALDPGQELLVGVTVSGDQAYAVGRFGTILRRTDSGWVADGDLVTEENLHAAWIDPGGDVWAVGGKFDLQPTRSGVLLHKGLAIEGSLP